MKQETAEMIALKALGWLAADEDLFGTFLGATGASVDDLSKSAQQAEFLGSILDFLLMDDAWVMGFCEAESLAYEMPMRARAVLPGGAEIHWT
ncbi:DUF3572 family protein [Pseudorhodobacter turbinis]|uniref:DUF3572 family protein n=1 Tax=Pseudorhodobacter turbinis TaxID=2500533 RepID=A0A4P8EHG1_9RHOB|nr:DUF3572 domain-containing protein [Pseudorhodobacter turbinis]QCO56610.1 DUF3572 family protein [Pseudorhodobacter turbinis]